MVGVVGAGGIGLVLGLLAYGITGTYDTVIAALSIGVGAGGIPTGLLIYMTARAAKKGHDAGVAWLGEAATQLEFPVGVYRSADGMRQFRQTSADSSDVLFGAHVHYEALDSGTGSVLKSIVVRVRHVPADDWPVRNAEVALVAPAASEASVGRFVTARLVAGRLEEVDTLPAARYLALVPAECGVLVLRFSAEKKYAGDSWHASRSQATAQIAIEYPSAHLMWRTISRPIPVRRLARHLDHLTAQCDSGRSGQAG